jgi:hypothetical protein
MKRRDFQEEAGIFIRSRRKSLYPSAAPGNPQSVPAVKALTSGFPASPSFQSTSQPSCYPTPDQADSPPARKNIHIASSSEAIVVANSKKPLMNAQTIFPDFRLLKFQAFDIGKVVATDPAW